MFKIKPANSIIRLEHFIPVGYENSLKTKLKNVDEVQFQFFLQ